MAELLLVDWIMQNLLNSTILEKNLVNSMWLELIS